MAKKPTAKKKAGTKKKATSTKKPTATTKAAPKKVTAKKPALLTVRDLQNQIDKLPGQIRAKLLKEFRDDAKEFHTEMAELGGEVGILKKLVSDLMDARAIDEIAASMPEVKSVPGVKKKECIKDHVHKKDCITVVKKKKPIKVVKKKKMVGAK